MSIARTKPAPELLGVPDVPTSGRGRLVAKAIDLFYSHGFFAVGIDQIIAEAGVTKSTFYKHFESKDELITEAVRMRDEWETAAWDRAVRERVGEDPIAQLLGYFEVLDEWFNAPDFGGCMFINAGVEFPNPNDPIHQAAAAHKAANRAAFRDLAERAGLQRPAVFADRYMTLMEGVLVIRQVQGRNDAARVALPMVELLIETHRA